MSIGTVHPEVARMKKRENIHKQESALRFKKPLPVLCDVCGGLLRIDENPHKKAVGAMNHVIWCRKCKKWFEA